ncbi:MAG TPA: mechanosensitive ion channel family protein [Afifellaceae bacterium]|nr:mechanosensitive ion channel family protein [Afifellaceae bacterium]
MDLAQLQADFGLVAAMLWQWAALFLPRLAAALLILVAGFVLAGWAARAIRGVADRTARIDPTLKPVIAAFVRYAILLLVAVAVLGQLGVQTTSLLAAIGAIGLGIGLAMQGTLANLAAGIMLLWLRPFEVGDFIERDGIAGTVEELNLFHTQIRTWDGIFRFVPNSELWNQTLTNYSRNPTRLVILEFGISYSDDIAAARRLLDDLAAEHQQVLADPAPVTVPLRLDDSAVVLQLRAWAPVASFWNTRWDLTQEGKKRLEAAGFTIPFPQRVIHYGDGAPEAAAA